MSKSKPQRSEIEHNEHCWQYGQHHYECALKYIEELSRELQFQKESGHTPQYINYGNH